MQVLIVMVLTFALCFAVDKGFNKIFRRKPQHKSGKSVRLTKKYMLFGILILFFAVLLAANAIGKEDPRQILQLLVLAGCLLLMGGGLVVYFVSFGVYYDHESFLFSSFGKKSQTYRFGQITEQQLLVTRGGICIELFLDDGRDLGIYANMEGAYDFLDAAFAGWCREKGLTGADCPWYDPANSCWFPPHDPEAAAAAENTVSYELQKDDSDQGTKYKVEPSDRE